MPTTSIPSKRSHAAGRKPGARRGSRSTVRATLRDAVSTGLEDTVAAMRRSATDRAVEAGPKLLEIASDKAEDATEKLIAWAKKHPIKTAAAAAALFAATKLIQAAMRRKSSAG